MFVTFQHPDQWHRMRYRGVSPLGGQAFAADDAQAHAVWLDAAGDVRARCSLWWLRTPALPRQTIGTIGHYAADGIDSGLGLLCGACRALQQRGCTMAIGPMDGNTWRAYRFVVQSSAAPAFFLEPDHPDQWPRHFALAGFRLLAAYWSAVCDDLTVRDPRSDSAARRLREHGVTVRTLSPERLQSELQAIHAVSGAAFPHAFLYQPIEFAQLQRHWRPLLPCIDAGLVLVAQREDDVVGFALGLPDHCQTARGERVDTVILKTLAVRPTRSLAGLGLVLVQQLHDIAQQRRLRRVIHAMMHEGNHRALALSSRYARPMRRYGLFARELH